MTWASYRGMEVWTGVSRPVLLKKNVNLRVLRNATRKVGMDGLCYVQSLPFGLGKRISYLLLRNKSPPRFCSFTEQTFINSHRSEGQESRSGLAGWFCSEVSGEVAIWLLGLGHPLPSWLMWLLAGFRFFLAVSGAPLVLSASCLSFLKTCIAPEWFKREREQNLEATVLPKLISEVLPLHFCCILLVTQNSCVQCGRRLPKGVT